jgi:flagellar biosynthesis protein FlhF
VVLKGCILTKIDEATQLGNALTVLLESDLPISYLSTGQRVPEDIEKIHARDLIDRAIVLGQQNSQNIDEQAFRLGMGKEISNAQ